MSSYIFELLLSVGSLVVGIVIHESAHALAAYMLGDATAKQRGRVSLNPLNHIDPFGTVILPLLMYAAGGVFFAFAKPVPVYLNHLKHPKRDEVIVSLAGPASNLLLAGVGAVVLWAVFRYAPLQTYDQLYTAMTVGETFVLVNLSLCFFNLIPIPPLDGSSVIVPFLRGRALQTYYQVQRYAMPVLIVVLYLLPRILGFSLISVYYRYTVYPVAGALLNFALGPLVG